MFRVMTEGGEAVGGTHPEGARRLRRLSPLCVIAMLVIGYGARADNDQQPTEQLRLVLAQGSSIRLEGNSTVHPFASTATDLRLDATLTLPAGAHPTREVISQALHTKDAVRLQLSVPVRGLKSGDGRLDENMYSTLKQKNHPVIVFRLQGYDRGSEIETKAGTQVLTLHGNLTVAGKERPVRITAALEERDGAIRAIGKTELLMTDFGIDPPTFFLVVKTENRIVIRYDLELRLVAPEPVRASGTGAVSRDLAAAVKLLLNANWNPYLAQAPFVAGRLFQGGMDAVVKAPVGSGELAVEVEGNCPSVTQCCSRTGTSASAAEK